MFLSTSLYVAFLMVAETISVDLASLLLGDIESPNCPLGLLWHHPSGIGKIYFITARRGWKSRILMWSPLILQWWWWWQWGMDEGSLPPSGDKNPSSQFVSNITLVGDGALRGPSWDASLHPVKGGSLGAPFCLWWWGWGHSFFCGVWLQSSGYCLKDFSLARLPLSWSFW